MTRSRRLVVRLARLVGFVVIAGCAGNGGDSELDGAAEGADANANYNDGAGGTRPHALDGAARVDVELPAPDTATGSGGAAGARVDAAAGGAAGRSGSSGAGGVAGSAGASGSGAGDAGGGGAAGSGGTSEPDGGADADAAWPDASSDTIDDSSLDHTADAPNDAATGCKGPAAAGGLVDDATITRLEGVTHITGDLTLSLTNTQELSALGCLESVDGTLWIQKGELLVTASLPRLQTVSGAVRVDRVPSLTTILLPRLSSVGQSAGISIAIDNLYSLTSIAIPVLGTAPGTLLVRDNGNGDPGDGGNGDAGDGGNGDAGDGGNRVPAGPLSLDFQMLTAVGGLELIGNGGLHSLDTFSHLASISGNIAVQRNGAVVSASFPNLATVSGSVSFKDQAELARISFPELTTVGQSGDISLLFGLLPSLTSISAPKLAATPANTEFFSLGGARSHTTDPLALDFRSLMSVGGLFYMQDLPSLVATEGFSALASVRGMFSLIGLTHLERLAFFALATVGRNIVLVGDDALTVAAFPALSKVSGAIDIGYSDELRDIALPVLATVGQDWLDPISIRCQYLLRLRSISAPSLVSTASSVLIDGVPTELPISGTTALDFQSLKTIEGRLVVTDMPRLTSLTGFSALTTIGGDVAVSWNSALTSATFPALTTIGGDIEISWNSALTSATFPNLTRVSGGMLVTNGAQLSSIALPALSSVGQARTQGWSLHFEALPALTSLAAPALVTTPAGALLRGVGLRELDGLGQLTSVGGSLVLFDNGSLESVVLPALANVGGLLEVDAAAALSTISMPALTTVGQENGYSINFSRLPKLTSISLPSLTKTLATILFRSGGDASPSPGSLTVDVGTLSSVGGGLWVHWLWNLQRLALPRLVTVNNDMVIADNQVLAELVAPAPTAVVNGFLQVTGNPALPMCSAKAFAASCAVAGNTLVGANKPDACGF
jgi:hypothetical protein